MSKLKLGTDKASHTVQTMNAHPKTNSCHMLEVDTRDCSAAGRQTGTVITHV